MKQQFVLNDGSKPTLEVVKQKSHRYDGLDIQISQVLDFSNYELCDIDGEFAKVKVSCRYIYEEIDPSEDSVIYARYMGVDNINKFYPWWND